MFVAATAVGEVEALTSALEDSEGVVAALRGELCVALSRRTAFRHHELNLLVFDDLVIFG